MAKQPKFDVLFSPDVVDHLDAIDVKYHSGLKRIIDEQLGHTPDKETRNRKPLRRPAPFDVSWELRCGPQNSFRVFYKIDFDQRIVGIVAIGVKDRNKLFFGSEEFKP